MSIEFRMSKNADPNASFSLSTWILKSPTIKTLSAASTNSDKKSPNSLKKVCMEPWGPVYSSQYKHHRGFIINIFFLLIMLYEAPLFQRSYT